MNKPIKRIILLLGLLAVIAFGWNGTAFAETYTYDAQGRLTTVVYDDGSSIAYTYDAAGNLTQRQIMVNSPPSGFDLVSPADGATGLGTSVTFVWKKATDAEGDIPTYEIVGCEDAGFSGCTPTVVAAAGQVISFAGAAGLFSGLVLFGAVVGARRRPRWRRWFMMSVVSLTIMGLVSGCGGGAVGTPPPPLPPTDEVSFTVAGLNTATTYYWKVVASDGSATTESATRSFTTQ